MNVGRILVVDDDKSTRSLIQDGLKEFGHEVTTACNGEDALAKFSSGTFDCVVADLFMPKTNGLELLKGIRSQDKDVSFILLTGYPTIETAVSAIKQGANDYVAKSFQMVEDISVKIERALDTKKAASSLKTMTGLFWGLLLSILVWLVLGIILGLAWKRLSSPMP